MKDLSILIPSRNEQFLDWTIQDILQNIEADTEVIAALDGAWPIPGHEILQHDRVNILYVPQSIGQRAATNMAAKLAKGRYLMKVDAHCAFDKGFDRKMLEGFAEVGDDVTMVPVMHNLWAYDWKCYRCGSRWYQGPTPSRCMKQEGQRVVPNEACGETQKFRRAMTWTREARKGQSAYQNWKGRWSPANSAYCFDAEPHFQYHKEYMRRPEVVKQAKETGFTETMSLQGSCFMATREKYWDLELCGEELGSWGNQGIEVACKTWLSGGRVLVNHRTWYAHLFRTQNVGDFTFPYRITEKEVQKTKKNVWDFFLNGQWDKQVHPVSWLVEKFWPIICKNKRGELVQGWTKQDLDKLKEQELGR